MKKNFRNRLLTVTAACAASFLLLSGFDSALTVQEISDNMTAAIKSAGGLSCDVKGTADVSLDVSAGGNAQSLPFTGTVDYSVQLIADPIQIAVSGNMEGDASAMGMAGSMGMEMYLVGNDDGSGTTYVRMTEGEDTEWHAASIPAEDMEKVTNPITAALSGDYSVLGGDLDLQSIQEELNAQATLAPEEVNVNGVDCYEITQSIDGETFFNLISTVSAAIPQAGLNEETLSAFQMLFNGIRMDIVTDCSVEDFSPVYAGMDLSGSDFTTIAQMFGSMMVPSSEEDAEAPEIGATVNALNLAMNYSAPPAAVEIPAEALAAEIETSLSLSDVAGAAGEANPLA